MKRWMSKRRAAKAVPLQIIVMPKPVPYCVRKALGLLTLPRLGLKEDANA